MMRAKMKKTIVDYAVKANSYELLEAKFSIMANDYMHKITDQVKKESGSIDTKRIFNDWEAWLNREIKKKGD